MSDSLLSLAYKKGPTVDRAPTGAAKCQVSKKNIEKGALRVNSTEGSRSFGEQTKRYIPDNFVNPRTKVCSYALSVSNNQGRCKATGRLFQKGEFKLKVQPPHPAAPGYSLSFEATKKFLPDVLGACSTAAFKKPENILGFKELPKPMQAKVKSAFKARAAKGGDNAKAKGGEKKKKATGAKGMKAVRKS